MFYSTRLFLFAGAKFRNAYLCQYRFQNCCFKINRINWICAATQTMTEHLYHIVHEVAFLCTLIVRNRGGHYPWSVVNNSNTSRNTYFWQSVKFTHTRPALPGKGEVYFFSQKALAPLSIHYYRPYKADTTVNEIDSFI